MTRQDYTRDRAKRDLVAAFKEMAGDRLKYDGAAEAAFISKHADDLASAVLSSMSRRWQFVERARPERRTK